MRRLTEQLRQNAKGKRQKFTRLWRGKIRPAGYFARITDLPG
jgi:hypothetical protein